ncbi:MAG: cell division protein FtsZ, partial [Bacteroidota bacterium]
RKFEKTVEFKDIATPINRNRRGYSYEEPYRKDVDISREEEERRLYLERETQRRERLRGNTVKLNNPQNIVDLENEPAYVRRRVHLDDVPDSSEVDLSKWTISDSEESQLRSDNSFLHDNVD